MNITLWIVQGLLALAFLLAGSLFAFLAAPKKRSAHSKRIRG